MLNTADPRIEEISSAHLTELQKKVDEYKAHLEKYEEVIEEYTRKVTAGLENTNLNSEDVDKVYNNLYTIYDDFINKVIDSEKVSVFTDINRYIEDLNDVKGKSIVLEENKKELERRLTFDIKEFIENEVHPTKNAYKIGKITDSDLLHPLKNQTCNFKLFNNFGMSDVIRLNNLIYDLNYIIDNNNNNNPLSEHDIVKIERNCNIKTIEFSLLYNQYNKRWFEDSDFDFDNRTYIGDEKNANIITRHYNGVIILTELDEKDANNLSKISIKAKIISPDKDIFGSGGKSIGPEINLDFKYDEEYIYIFFNGFKPYGLNWKEINGKTELIDLYDESEVLNAHINFEWYASFTDISYKQGIWVNKIKELQYENFDVTKLPVIDSIQIKPLKDAIIKHKGIGYTGPDVKIAANDKLVKTYTNYEIQDSVYISEENYTRGWVKNRPYKLFTKITDENDITGEPIEIYDVLIHKGNEYYATNYGIYKQNHTVNEVYCITKALSERKFIFLNIIDDKIVTINVNLGILSTINDFETYDQKPLTDEAKEYLKTLKEIKYYDECQMFGIINRNTMVIADKTLTKFVELHHIEKEQEYTIKKVIKHKLVSDGPIFLVMTNGDLWVAGALNENTFGVNSASSTPKLQFIKTELEGIDDVYLMVNNNKVDTAFAINKEHVYELTSLNSNINEIETVEDYLVKDHTSAEYKGNPLANVASVIIEDGFIDKGSVYFLTENGDLYVKGNNKYGQLGIVDKRTVNQGSATPLIACIDLLLNDKYVYKTASLVNKIITSPYCTYIFKYTLNIVTQTYENKVFFCGTNFQNALGVEFDDSDDYLLNFNGILNKVRKNEIPCWSEFRHPIMTETDSPEGIKDIYIHKILYPKTASDIENNATVFIISNNNILYSSGKYAGHYIEPQVLPPEDEEETT
jgi:hypothetical protein